MNLPNQSMPVSRNYFGPALHLDSKGEINPSACVGASVNSQGKVCVSLPIIGTRCIPLRTPLPRNTRVSACMGLKKRFGIPTGVCASINANGHEVAKQCFGL